MCRPRPQGSGGAGGGAVENGRLRLPALQPAHVPVASDIFAPLVLWLFGDLPNCYTSLVAAYADRHEKRLIASFLGAHMACVTKNGDLFLPTSKGVDGAIFQMLSHGFISGALFLAVGVIYDRMHTREIDAYGGLVNRMPVYAAVFFAVHQWPNVGLPGTSGFVGEFLTFMAVFQVNTWGCHGCCNRGHLVGRVCAVALSRVVMGELIKASLKGISDMDRREKAMMAPLVAATLILGVYPAFITDIIGPSVSALVDGHATALQAHEAATQLAQN